MATVKNFGLAGVSSDVQFGKGNARVKENAGTFEVRNSADTDYVELLVKTPTGASNANAAITKEYADSIAAGLDPKESVIAASTESTFATTGVAPTEAGTGLGHTLTNAGTQAAFALDGVILTAGQRVLMKDEVLPANNGIYTVTTVGTIAINWVLTRATDFDGTPVNEVSGGAYTFVESGTAYADTGWVVSSPTGNAVVDTTSILWAQFSSAGLITISATAGETTVAHVGNDYQIGLDATYTGQTSITTLGTIATGTWNGTTIAVADGGTGQTVADDITAAAGARVAITNGATSIFNGGTNVTLDVVEANLLLDNIGGSLTLTTGVTGILPVANGGSGAATHTQDGILLGNGTSAMTTVSGTTGQMLLATAGAPAFSTTTMPTTIVANSIMVANAADTMVALTATDAAGDQLMQWNDTTNLFEFVTVSSVGGSKYSTITGDTGSATAAGVADSIAMTGGSAITTVAAEGTDSVTFDLDINSLTAVAVIAGNDVGATDTFAMYDVSALGNVKVTAQDIVDAATINVFTGITGDTGSATVDGETDALNFAGGEGIVTTASDLSGVADVSIALDLNEIAVATPIAADELIFADGGATNGKVSVTSFLSTFGIVEDTDFATQGIMTSNGAGVYTQRSVVASAVAGDQGISVTGGNGSTDITVGVDLTGLTANGGNMLTGTEFMVFDGTNNVKMTGQEIADGVAALGNDDRIVSPDTFTTVIANDTGTVTINPENAAGSATQNLATFENVVDGPNMNFTNAAGVTGEIRMEAGDAGGFGASSTANVDIRFVPGLNGEVFFGEAGTDATISASNGIVGENMIILAGDGSAGAGGNINLTPGTGTTTNGVVNITDSASNNILSLTGVATAVTSMDLTNAATGGSPTFSVVSTDTNVDMTFVPLGTGVISVAGTLNYEANVTADDDIPNKLFVDNALSAQLAGSVGTFKFTVPLNANGDTVSGDTIPAGATVTKVMINVGVADTAATLTVGVTADEYATIASNDPSATGLYMVEGFSTTVGALKATVATTAAVAGATADVIVEYRNA